MRDDLRTLPKIELHCHLDGSLDPEFVRYTLEQQGESVPLPKLQELLQAPENCASLAEYLQRFQLPIRCMDTPQQVRRSAYTFLRSLKEDGVRYAEVRFSPALLENSSLTARQAVEEVLSGLDAARRESGVEYGVILCAMRHHTQEKNEEMFRLAREYLGQGVCGVDLAGDEAARPNGEFFPLFEQAYRLGLPYTIHAGECGSAQSVADALEMGARRIGHGIAMEKDPSLQKRCAQLRVGVEMCPVSNLQTKAVARLENYPIRKFLSNGVLVTINTDNRTVSGTSLTREYGLLAEQFAFTMEELKRLSRNAVECSFASEELKEQLLREL
ncbi:adenosine deaminase [Angelakisella massiliensis]|uniref:adenosine deaminase n=1 Tax=Angelakisella massiliensis TaxID=1871018 RepID=UPI0023A8349A|nr:adenosine deaminase [Angelakisella massiliensis]